MMWDENVVGQNVSRHFGNRAQALGPKGAKPVGEASISSSTRHSLRACHQRHVDRDVLAHPLRLGIRLQANIMREAVERERETGFNRRAGEIAQGKIKRDRNGLATNGELTLGAVATICFFADGFAGKRRLQVVFHIKPIGGGKCAIIHRVAGFGAGGVDRHFYIAGRKVCIIKLDGGVPCAKAALEKLAGMGAGKFDGACGFIHHILGGKSG